MESDETQSPSNIDPMEVSQPTNPMPEPTSTPGEAVAPPYIENAAQSATQAVQSAFPTDPNAATPPEAVALASAAPADPVQAQMLTFEQRLAAIEGTLNVVAPLGGDAFASKFGKVETVVNVLTPVVGFLVDMFHHVGQNTPRSSAGEAAAKAVNPQ